MTDLLERTRRAVPSSAAGRPASAVLPACLAAVWVAVITTVGAGIVVLMAWAADTRSGSSASSAIRTAEQIVLVAQGASLHLGSARFGLIPLGLTLLPAWLLMRAGSSVARVAEPRGLGGLMPGVLALAGSYGALGLAAGALAHTGSVRVDVLRSFVGPAILALLVGGYGALREAGLRGAVWNIVPVPLSPVVRGGALVVAVVLAAGAVLVAAALLVSMGRAQSLVDSLGPGLFGGFVMVLASAAYAPGAATWAAGVVVGPGFSSGAGTAVGAFHTSLGPVPALPLLAALPEGPVPYLSVLILVPMAAGGVAGAMVGRAAGPVDELNAVLLRALYCAPVAGVLLAAVTWLTGGSAGPGRFAQVGPSPWQLGLAITAEVALPAVIGAWWALRRSE